MWWCNDCEDYFEEPEIIKEDGYTFCACPKCHEWDVYECNDKCDVCGEIVYETKWVGNKELCQECYERLGAIMNEVADKVVGELDIDRLDAEDLVSHYFD